MPDRTVYLTREGFKRLDDELEHLRTVKRPEVSERIRRSKDMTDVDGNAEYDEAKSEQGFIEGRIVELERALAGAQIIADALFLTIPSHSQPSFIFHGAEWRRMGPVDRSSP